MVRDVAKRLAQPAEPLALAWGIIQCCYTRVRCCLCLALDVRVRRLFWNVAMVRCASTSFSGHAKFEQLLGAWEHSDMRCERQEYESVCSSRALHALLMCAAACIMHQAVKHFCYGTCFLLISWSGSANVLGKEVTTKIVTSCVNSAIFVTCNP